MERSEELVAFHFIRVLILLVHISEYQIEFGAEFTVSVNMKLTG